MNSNLLLKNTLNQTILVILLLTISFKVFSANSATCLVNPTTKVINISGINISPNSQVGDLLSNQTEYSSTIGNCKSPSGEQPFLYHDPQSFTVNGQAMNLGSKVNYTYKGITCPVFNTTVTGIGIVWFNFNSGANSWMCVDRNIRRGLPKNSSQKNTIIDSVFLVRTGDIHPGEFNYNISLPTYIVDGTTNLPDPGQPLAYDISIKAPNTTINVGVCSVTYDNNSLSFTNLPTRSIIVKNNKLSQSIKVNLSCSGGFVPPTVNIKAVSPLYLNDTSLAKSTNQLAGLSLFKSGSSSPINYGSSIPVNISENKGSVTFIPSVYSQETDAKLLSSSPIIFDIKFIL